MKLFATAFLFLLGLLSAFAERAPFDQEHCNRIINTVPHVPQNFKQRACAFLGRNVGVEFNIIQMPEDANGCSRTVVLIGENHQSPPTLRAETYQLARPFPVRLHEAAWDIGLIDDPADLVEVAEAHGDNEGVSVEEALKLAAAENNRWFWQPRINVPGGSPMEDLMSDGGLRLFYDENGFRYGFRFDRDMAAADIMPALSAVERFNTVGEIQCSNFGISEFDPETMTPQEFLRTYADQIGTPDFPPIDITMENGHLNHYNYQCQEFMSLQCMLYIQTARNHRMATNIENASNALPCHVPTMAIVGRSHLHPLTKLLTQPRRQGQLFDETLSSYSYNTIHTDPEHGQ